MNCVKSGQCLLHNMSIFKFGKTFNFYKILFNYPNQSSVSKNSSGNVKKIYTQTWKCQFLRFLHINTFFVKTLVQISTLTEVNYLISKELYQKQNGFKFKKLHYWKWIFIMELILLSFIWPSINFRIFKKKQALSL